MRVVRFLGWFLAVMSAPIALYAPVAWLLGQIEGPAVLVVLAWWGSLLAVLLRHTLSTRWSGKQAEPE